MRLGTRKILDKAFSGMGISTIILMAAALVVILAPILVKGAGAVVFKATVEHRRLMSEQFNRGNKHAMLLEMEEVARLRKPIYDMMGEYEEQLSASLDSAVSIMERIAERSDNLGSRVKRRLKRYGSAENFEDKLLAVTQSYESMSDSDSVDELKDEAGSIKLLLDNVSQRFDAFAEVKEALHVLLGPFPGEQNPVLVRNQYGQTRWGRAQIKLHEVLYKDGWDYSDASSMGVKTTIPRVEMFRGTALEELFSYLEDNAEAVLIPRWTFYAGFFIDSPKDSHIFGGILPELLGTLYLTIGAMFFALPIGIIAAIFFTEYAGDHFIVRLLRTCVSTLAGVPSIVFGLFGLAFFMNTIHLPKSVLVGAMTLAILILPTIIRASEEAIRAVPHAYREAAMALGAGKWHTVISVIIPAALPGILTGSVISMGRAAGETAPIIFTAAVSVGRALKPMNAVFQPTPALSWNIYNLCTEHEAVDEIRHVQFGMVATLILVVLILNSVAIFMRARISKKLKG